MAEWTPYTIRMTIVGPRWRDRLRIAWLVLRGHTRMEYSLNIQVTSPSTEAVVAFDGPLARLIKDDGDDG